MLKSISGKDILQMFDTSGCSSLRRVSYPTIAQGLNVRPILQGNAATSFRAQTFFLRSANPKNMVRTQIQKPLNPPSLQIDDVAEDSWRQRFANCMRLERRNARGDFVETKGGCLVPRYLNIWSRLATPPPCMSRMSPGL